MDRFRRRPDQEVDLLDLIEAIQEQFSGEELELLTPWLDGESWEMIGQKIGTTADAARVACPEQCVESGIK